MDKPTYILGIHANYFHQDTPVHDSNVCLIKDGKIVAAVAEERLSRVKGDGKYPENAIKLVLQRGKIDFNDVDYVAYSTRHPRSANFCELKSILSTFIDTRVFLGRAFWKTLKYYLSSFKITRKVSFEYCGISKPLLFNEHHLSHAASAYYTAPFENALVVTLDGGGDGLDGSVYYGNENKLKKLWTIPHHQSPATMYSGLTNDLGYRRLRHEGKLTGLAAFGSPEAGSLSKKKVVEYSRSKRRFISKLIAKHHKNLGSKSPYFGKLLETHRAEDLAAYLQANFEKVILEFIEDAYEKTIKKGYNVKNIALAGGAFANVKLNQRILELGYFEDIYVFPAMGDDGLSVGAALNIFFSKKPIVSKTCSVIQAPYFGPSYSDIEIESALKEYGLQYSKEDNIESKLGKLMAEGNVIARFEGKMEYGPRALGHRSLIASPFDKTINDWLNEKLRRTEFMPFAPSILAEDAADYFENFGINNVSAANHMTITYNVKKEMRDKIPAVVHIDGTARPQIVHKTISPSYYAIIESFKKNTGIPVVLNTSFNMHEEPIVCTPQDAIRGFLDSGVEYLAIESYLVQRKS